MAEQKKDRLSDISTMKEILSRHGFTFSKALGQNFLINPSVCPRMAELCGVDEESGVLEIGPGIGVLTRELAKRSKKTVAVELDTRLLPVLAETLADYPNASVVHGDVMKLDLHHIIKEEFPGMKVAVCANLPYYITSPVIMKILEEKLPITALTVMVQKEAADRICAKPGTRACGAVSAAVQYYAEPYIVANVPPNCFMPRPAVGSAVIRLTRHQKPPVEVMDEKLMFRLIRASFNQRRKTLANGLKNSGELNLSKEVITAAIEKLGKGSSVRGEALDLEEFARLTNIIKEEMEHEV